MANDKKVYSKRKWIKVRDERRKLDDYTCKLCGEQYKTPQSITIDHIIMRKLLPESKWYDIDNLWTLCKCCNGVKQRIESKTDTHSLINRTKTEWRQLIMANSGYCRKNGKSCNANTTCKDNDKI